MPKSLTLSVIASSFQNCTTVLSMKAVCGHVHISMLCSQYTRMSNCLVTLKDINETKKCSVKQKDIQKIERICRLSERYLDENERIFFFAKRREVHDGICDVKEYWKEAEGTKFHWMPVHVYLFIYLHFCSLRLSSTLLQKCVTSCVVKSFPLPHLLFINIIHLLHIARTVM